MRYVVGVDGSAGSRDALRWAIEEARHHGANIDAVYAFPYATPAFVGFPEAMYVPETTYEVAEKEAETYLDEVVAAVLRGEPAGVEIDRIVTEGGAARRLLEIAERADLLVVGSRGLGGFRGLLLGSVSHQCASHASCPVVVIPPSRSQEA